MLLVQDYPSYEFRYLKNLLDRDSTIELHSLLQDADPQFAKEDEDGSGCVPRQPRGFVQLRRGDSRRRQSGIVEDVGA